MTQPAGQPLDQLVRTLDLIQDEHDHQPQFFKANHDMHAPRLLEIAQALRVELANSQAATETNREVARVLLDELAVLRPATP